jgi:hypothetical protein
MASKVLARQCTGTVYVLLPPGKGRNWDSKKIWNTDKWPNLQRPDVHKIIRLNMNDPNQQEVILEHGPKRDVAPFETRANDKCVISPTQWDNDQTDVPGDCFDLDFDVHNEEGVVLGD